MNSTTELQGAFIPIVQTLDYGAMTEDQLLEIFSLYDQYGSPDLDIVLYEIIGRIALGKMSAWENSPSPITDDLPHWLNWPIIRLLREGFSTYTKRSIGVGEWLTLAFYKLIGVI